MNRSLDDQNLSSFYNRGLGSVTGSSLGVESIGEFQTLTNTYGSQFGGNGAVMNAVTKSGTNTLHGSLYEFLRNSAMDARNFTDPSTVPEYRRNQFGGTAGGPVRVPPPPSAATRPPVKSRRTHTRHRRERFSSD